MSGAAPTPVGGDGQLCGTRRQRVATAIAPIVKELIMLFIPETEALAFRAHLDKKLEGPVTLDLFIEPKSAIVVPGRPECELCQETRVLLEDVASLSDQITDCSRPPH
jgi:hypothetical protein